MLLLVQRYFTYRVSHHSRVLICFAASGYGQTVLNGVLRYPSGPYDELAALEVTHLSAQLQCAHPFGLLICAAHKMIL